MVWGYHKNKFNFFNQAQIIALNVLGEVFALPNPIPEQQKEGGRFEDEMQYDPSTIHKLKALYFSKMSAVEQGKYEEAITIKNVIKKLKGYGVLLNKMEE